MIRTIPVSPADTQTMQDASSLNGFVNHGKTWRGSLETIAWEKEDIQQILQAIERPFHVVSYQNRIGFTQSGTVVEGKSGDVQHFLSVPAIMPKRLGSEDFCNTYQTQYAYMAGAMAGGIASEEMVIALGKAGILGSFGAGGLPAEQVERAIAYIQSALPAGTYCFNLLHNPNSLAAEQAAVDLYLKHGVTTVEASAFITLTPSIVHYRASGLRLCENDIQADNRVIAKVSRQEVAAQFMRPAPAKILAELVKVGQITPQQAALAEQVPMADDITVEADSGGHTDNRPLVCLLPAMLAIRDHIQSEQNYSKPVRIGAAGGISTPRSALSAFALGADYVVTGSVNQACVEAGTSEAVKKLLAKAEMADVMMAPAADMFEMGVKLQVLKKGTLFPMRAQKLYSLYKAYEQIEDIPEKEREKLEKQIFRQPLEEVWQETVEYLSERNPKKLARAQRDPKLKMALIFRRYLGLSSRWPKNAEPGREMDYQIWCGPAMGAFNEWTKGTYLEHSEQRHVVDVAHHIMTGSAIIYRLQNLKMQGLQMPAEYLQYQPHQAAVHTPPGA